MTHRPTRAAHLDTVARCGALLVLALIVALPLALALCPGSSLDGGASGAGVGTGDEVAAALTGLDRGLHRARILPAPAPCDAPAVLLAASPRTLVHDADAYEAAAPPCDGSPQTSPGDARPGPAGLGYQLRR